MCASVRWGVCVCGGGVGVCVCFQKICKLKVKKFKTDGWKPIKNIFIVSTLTFVIWKDKVDDNEQHLL